MIPAALALSLAGRLLLGGAGEGDAASEYERFEGVWRFASVEVEGVRQPEVSYPAHRMIMASDGTYVVVQGPRVTHGTFELDPSRSPKHYRFTVTSGPAKGLTGIGIYEVERETLKLCLSLGGDQRPAAFASQPGSGLMFQVFRREGRDVAQALQELASPPPP